MWDLIQERIVTPGNDSGNYTLPFMKLTQYGQEYISTAPPHYYDPEGYLKYLKTIVPSLDAIIEQYVFESLHCFRRQLFFSSAVMIGAAAEKAILLLLQAIHDSMSNVAKKKKVKELIDRPNLPEIFDTITQTTESLIKSKTIPYDIHRGTTEHLFSLFEMIRVQVDQAKIFLSLQTIPTTLECVYKLIDWFKSNKIP
jgi:hypothetical protein